MSREPDRLFDLLPQFHRRRDAETGGALRALLGVIAEQVDLVETDLEQLYDDWFIETCADWAVPYLGDLVGYRALRGYEEAVAGGGAAARLLSTRLAPRADVAATVTSRRRKGTLPLLEDIARTVAGWPARAVEVGPLLAGSQPVRLYPDRPDLADARQLAAPGRTADLRRGADLDQLGSPFDGVARTAGRARTPAVVGLHAWRLEPHSVTRAPAYCVDRARNLYTFSILGNDTPLVTRPVPEPSPTHLATAENVPGFITRRALRDRLADHYGPGKSFEVFRDDEDSPVPPVDVVVADLSRWRYRPRRRQVVVDPVLGRIAFGARCAPKRGVWVTYHHAFSDDTGGGEYPRDRPERPGARVYRIGPDGDETGIMDAYRRWRREKEAGEAPADAVLEITGSVAFQEQLEFVLDRGDRLEVRAAEGARPVIRLLDWYSNRPDALIIRATEDDDRHDPDDRGRPGPPGVVLDGLLVTGRGVHVSGPVGRVVIRHSTLVPGWTLEPDCGPVRPEEPSLVVESPAVCVEVERSVIGTILVLGDEVRTEPIGIHLSDSVLDATGRDREALSGPECSHAHAVLSVHRTTVIGEVHAHAVRIGEDSVFHGLLHVARRGIGCLRFCSVAPGSRTPRRYRCDTGHRPRFASTRYGRPDYAQLAAGCPREIARGAEDGAELGAFHDLFQPQREDNLRARLEEFLPAGTTAAIVFVS
ncbi:hypothetical protein [Saccharothrix sp. Mg75]|uniref:hypothetical protein n=1 Tax=Saccharothrix sp. Mg75 TaxID=3445357 RepID=UPI003EEB3A57